MERDFFKQAEPKHLSTPQIPAVWETRWVPRRKAQVVAEVHNGLLSLEEACERYALTIEEFRSWQNAIDKYGLAGLRASHVARARH